MAARALVIATIIAAALGVGLSLYITRSWGSPHTSPSASAYPSSSEAVCLDPWSC